MHLALSGDNHAAILFNIYLQGFDGELCPDEGMFSYVKEEYSVVNCSIHSGDDDPGDDEVPWL